MQDAGTILSTFQDDTRGAAYAKIKWHIAPFLILLYIVAFIDRVNISFASLSMNHDLGFGAGIFFFGYLLFAVPSSLMLHKLGARRWIAIIMVFWGILSTFMAFIHGATTISCAAFSLEPPKLDFSWRHSLFNPLAACVP